MMLLLKAAIVLSVLLGFYKLFLQKESFFSTNRAYLLIGLVLTFVLPFVTLPELVDHQGIVEKVVFEGNENVGKEVFLTNETKLLTEAPKQDWNENTTTIIPSGSTDYKSIVYWIGLLYFFGVTMLSLNFLTQLMGIFIKINRSKDLLKDGRYVILDKTQDSEPCSFFNFIFISPHKYDTKTYEQILEHEKVHVRKYHSLDLLFSEIAIILLWFNPLVWLYRKEVEKNIEYQTDASLLASNRVVSEEYQMNLLNIASRKKTNSLVSNYNQSLIKKRIIMMNKQKSSSSSYWKYAFLAPTLFVTLLLLNRPDTLQAQENLSVDIQEEIDEHYDHHNEHSELPPLNRAAADGDEQKVRRLIKDGENVNRLVKGEGTSLYLALQHDHWEVANILLENGADPNLGSNSNGYPIMLAVMTGDPELVQLLVKKGADVDRDFLGDGNPLIQACKNGDLGMVKTLVSLKADINRGIKGDGNPLIMASKRGQLHVVKYLVGLGADVNYEVIGDEVPVIVASEQGHLSTVKFLIKNGADVNKVCKEVVNGEVRIRTALKMAKKKGHDEVVAYLISKGAKD